MGVLTAVEEIVHAAADIFAAQQRAESLSQYVMVKVVGSADPLGDAVQNEKLSQLRADVVRARLVAEGVPPTMLLAFSIGAPMDGIAERSAEQRLLNRSVFFRISMATSNKLPVQEPESPGGASPARAPSTPGAAGMGR